MKKQENPTIFSIDICIRKPISTTFLVSITISVQFFFQVKQRKKFFVFHFRFQTLWTKRQNKRKLVRKNLQRRKKRPRPLKPKPKEKKKRRVSSNRFFRTVRCLFSAAQIRKEKNFKVKTIFVLLEFDDFVILLLHFVISIY